MMATLLVRLLAAAFAMMALVWPGYGAIDLSDTWNPDGDPVLSGGWGLFFGVVLAVPFGVLCAAPRRAAPAVWSLLLACAALAAAAAASAEPQAAPLLTWLLVGTLSMAASGAVQPWRTLDVSGGPVLAVGAVSSPWLLYAWHMSANNRQGRFDTDFTMGVDHYCVQAALGLALALMVLLAAIWPRGRRQLATTAAVCALYLGVLALRWQDFPGSLTTWWAAGAIAWGVGVALWGWRRAPVTAAPPSPARDCEPSRTRRREEA